MNDITRDMSTLTKINTKLLDDLTRKSVYIFCDYIEEAILSGASSVDVNTGLGVISINFTDDEIKYKFTPSEELNSSVMDTIINEKNSLTDRLEESVVKKISKIYRDLL